MKKALERFTLILFVLILGYAISYIFPLESAKPEIMTAILGGLTLLIFSINLIINDVINKDFKYQDKLLASLDDNANAVYFLTNYDISKIKFMTKNIDKVLNLKLNTKEEATTLLFDIMSNPILEHNISNWDTEEIFLSPMITYKHPDYKGESIHLKVIIYPTYEGKKKNYIIVINNVEDEYSNQHKLIVQATDIKSRERKLNQITANSYDVELNVDLLSGMFSIKNLNDSAYYLGKDEEGLYGSRIADIIDSKIYSDDKENVLDKISLTNLEKIANTPSDPVSFRYRIKRNAEIEWLESTIYITNDKGLKTATILTKNVTENAEYIRKQNKLLEEALKNSEAASKAKDEFIKALSHDIRTPMTVILGISETGVKEAEDKTIKEDFESINEASKNLLEVIDGLLDIEKIEKGSVLLNEKEYETTKLFIDLQKLTLENIGKKDIKLNMNIAEDIPSKLFGDKAKLNTILLSLLTNAAVFTNTGEITFDVSALEKAGNSKLTFKISDTGKGIAKTKLKKIIEDSSIQSGLGLVKNAIELLNGSIDFESTEGKGTSVTVVLEQKILDSTNIGDINDYAVKEDKVNYFDANLKTILVVEDNKLNLKVARKLLAPYNVNIIDVPTGPKCIEVINSGEHIDLILLDQMMPIMTGTETLKELKKIEGFNIPTIALTADAIKGAKESYIKEGFDDYLAKPINIHELNEVLAKYIKD